MKNALLISLTLLWNVAAVHAAMEDTTEARESQKLVQKARPVREDSEYKPHIGLNLGLANAEGNYKSGAEIGVSAGYQYYIPWSVNVELSTAGNNYDGVGGSDFRRTKFIASVSYNFSGDIPILSQSYIGLGMGPMLENRNSSDDLAWGTMPVIGFDIPIRTQRSDYATLGFNVRYLVSSSGESNVFTANFATKYWF